MLVMSQTLTFIQPLEERWAEGRSSGVAPLNQRHTQRIWQKMRQSDGVGACREKLVVMISVSNVTMRYGAKLLFEDVSVTFTTGRRYGLTGPNGAGKSTFMKVLTGEIDAQKGSVVRPRKFGVLKQDQYEFDAYRVVDTVIMGNKSLWAAMEEREVIYNKPEMTDEDGSRLGELEGTVGDEDGYEAEANAAVLLQGLDIPDELHERKMSELQGGTEGSRSARAGVVWKSPGVATGRAYKLS